VDGPHTATALIAAAHPTLRALLALPHLPQATALARALLSLRLLPSLAFTADDVNAYLEADSFAVLVLHLGEREPGGLVAAVRQRSRAPILALGAERQPSQRVGALHCEGYAADTLAPAALARRAMALTLPPQPSWQDPRAWPAHTYTWGPLRLDPGRRVACWQGRPAGVTPMQFRLLLVLVQAEGAVVSPVELSRRVWGTEVAHDAERVVAHVRRIRRLLEPDPAHARFLLTVRGEGFRLADHDADWPATADRLVAVSPPAVSSPVAATSAPWAQGTVVTSAASGPQMP
jgi:DNA-binding response OmpR family regulator